MGGPFADKGKAMRRTPDRRRKTMGGQPTGSNRGVFVAARRKRRQEASKPPVEGVGYGEEAKNA